VKTCCLLRHAKVRIKLYSQMFLKIRVYDMVQPCDTTQVRPDSNFDVKISTVQFYTIEYNSKSNRWIELKLY